MSKHTKPDFPSSQKIENIFHAFGFVIPTTNDGRRIWPPQFKNFLFDKFNSSELTVKQISEECNVTHSMIYQWRAVIKEKRNPKPKRKSPTKGSFVEVSVAPDQPIPTIEKDFLVLRGENFEIDIPATVPILAHKMQHPQSVPDISYRFVANIWRKKNYVRRK